MRMSFSLTFIALLGSLLFAVSSSAQSVARTDIPPVLISGMEAYKPGNAEQAIKAWTKNSPLDGAQIATDEANNLRQAQSLYGPFQ
jgi:hypothetical protein